MSAPAYTTTIRLPNDEGCLRLIIQSWHKPKAEEVSKLLLEDGDSATILFHDSCHESVVVRSVSTRKRIMYCRGCGMRLEIPGIITFGELCNYFIAGERLPFFRQQEF